MISQIHIIPKIYSPWGAELFSTQPKKEKEKEEENPNSTIFSSSSNSTKLRWVGGKKNSQLNPPPKNAISTKTFIFLYGSYYPHCSRDSVSPVCGIFCMYTKPYALYSAVDAIDSKVWC